VKRGGIVFARRPFRFFSNREFTMADTVPDFSAGPALRTMAMPKDANPRGDIFGGWLMGQMDIAGGNTAAIRSGGRVATIAVEAMTFHRPVFVGDEVSCFTTIERVGRTSITVKVETWIRRFAHPEGVKVTEGTFTYVALDGEGRKRPVDVEV
jgi:acyl-CoA thioesterase YciA